MNAKFMRRTHTGTRARNGYRSAQRPETDSGRTKVVNGYVRDQGPETETWETKAPRRPPRPRGTANEFGVEPGIRKEKN